MKKITIYYIYILYITDQPADQPADPPTDQPAGPPGVPPHPSAPPAGRSVGESVGWLVGEIYIYIFIFFLICYKLNIFMIYHVINYITFHINSCPENRCTNALVCTYTTHHKLNYMYIPMHSFLSIYICIHSQI